MKPCHTVALALVVWYLMVPPLSADRHHVNYSIPFAEWQTFGRFDSFGKCQQERSRLVAPESQSMAHDFVAQHGGDNQTVATVEGALRAARCFRFDLVASTRN
jgi:hypothetical protein